MLSLYDINFQKKQATVLRHLGKATTCLGRAASPIAAGLSATGAMPSPDREACPTSSPTTYLASPTSFEGQQQQSQAHPHLALCKPTLLKAIGQRPGSSYAGHQHVHLTFRLMLGPSERCDGNSAALSRPYFFRALVNAFNKTSKFKRPFGEMRTDRACDATHF